jgi:hypothetical protein
MVSARSGKILSAEEILAESCADTLSDGPSDVLSESDDDYDDDDVDVDVDVDNKSYSGFEPEIARKMKNVCHLAGYSESGSIKKQDNDDRSEIYAGGRGTATCPG